MKTIDRLREEMEKRGIWGYIVTSTDFHNSEYTGESFKLREYLSGFTGSAGTLFVTADKALLWTDGRYFIQAAAELSGSGIELMKSREHGVPAIEKYIQDNCPENSRLGFDGRTVTAGFAVKLRKLLSSKKTIFCTDEDLGGLVWENRPPVVTKPVFRLPDEFSGMTRAQKLAAVRAKMNADCLIISALDETAWTLNLRGDDIAYNPVFLSFMLVFKDKVQLFADKKRFSDGIISELASDGAEILPYDSIYEAVGKLDCSVMLDLKAVNFRLFSSIPEKCRKVISRSPIETMKAVKSPAEISAEKHAHLKDGIAVTRFMKWLKETVGHERITEISAAEKLEEFRQNGEHYLGQSFAPIMAYKEHGAIVHYEADEKTDAEINPFGMLLSDTGGHYLDGTTDITRTYVLGKLSDKEKRAFTLVLAGHLELLHAVFPKGTRGSGIDCLAREPLWKAGLDFKHGTGHGVGFLLNVHEGPQRISCYASNDAPLEAGMITSDEPGVYIEGEFGVRHESLTLCEEAEYPGYLKFSPLTLVPFDPDGVDPEYLTPKQREYFNEYQKLVCDKLSPHLSKEEALWLSEITRKI